MRNAIPEGFSHATRSMQLHIVITNTPGLYNIMSDATYVVYQENSASLLQ